MKYNFLDSNSKEFPRMVIAGVSFACNAQCIHCIYSNFPETKKKSASQKIFMDQDIFKRIADQCSQHPGTLLRLVGFGEPLLHPLIIEMTGYAKQVGCNVGLITNGSLLGEEKAEKLLNTNIDAIDISVDAFSKKVYENIRVGLDFDKLVENVKGLVKLRNKLQKKTFIFCSIVEQAEVLPEIEDALKFWGEIADKVVTRKFLTFGLFDREEKRTPYYEKRIPCFLLYDRINVDVSGQIRLCGYDSFGQTDFGNIENISLREVWHGQELNRIRKCHQDGRFEEAGLCGDCRDWPYHSWEKNYITDSYLKRR